MKPQFQPLSLALLAVVGATGQAARADHVTLNLTGAQDGRSAALSFVMDDAAGTMTVRVRNTMTGDGQASRSISGVFWSFGGAALDVRGPNANGAFCDASTGSLAPWAPVASVTSPSQLWAFHDPDNSASGWANSYYSAAVQAATKSWKAFFFGSFDASNAITVDKPPAALWVMGLSARVFGLSSWSILVPEALMGVGTVALVTATVRRWFRPGAALLAGLVVATTPVAALMFRFNNPDALLVLLLAAGAYAVTRAIEDERSARWMALAGACVGFGFLAKMLQAFVILPVFAGVVLVAGAGSWRRRLRDCIVLGATTVLAGGWWVAIVELWPASSRPYIGGSQNDSVVELMLGYNGLGRLTGNETGSVTGGGAGGPAGTSMWGETGWLRMFDSRFGAQASWLIPAALVALAGGLVLTARRGRRDRTRAALLLWGGWLVITGIVFSLGQGIIHEYYTVALAPAIGAMVGIGASLLWDLRHRLVARLSGAAAVAVTAWWSVQLLHRSSGWHPWVAGLVAGAGVLGALLVAVGLHRRGWVLAAGVAAGVAGLAGPIGYTLDTIGTGHSGSLPLAGPVSQQGPGGFGGGPGGFGGGQGGPPPGATQGRVPGQSQAGQVQPGQVPGQSQAGQVQPGQQGGAATGQSQFPGRFGPGAGGNGGPGGLLDASTPSDALTDALSEQAEDYRWVLAVAGANQAAGYQLATDEAVLALGGFNGSDPAPTLAEFQSWVADGQVHYYLAGGGFGQQNGGASTTSEIGTWVTEHFQTVTVDGTTLYDLTAPIGG